FNPVPDRLRVVSNTGQNLRINPANGLVTTDADLNPGTPNIVGAAYLNSFDGATATTLYDIDSVTDSLYIQNPPNNGTVTQVGVGLGVGNITDVLGFDIQPLSGGGNAAFAAMSTNGTSSSLYTIDLVTGIATLVGSIGVAPTLVTGLAVVPAIANPPPPSYGTVLAPANPIRFTAANPSVIKSSAPVTGLISGDTIVGIDFRPATGQLYGLGSGGRLYTINTTTAVATLVASLAADPADLTSPFTTLSGTSFGVDFNPVPDRLRVVSNTGQNLRINPANGLVTTDADLNPGTPNIVGAAYLNSFDGATATTLYDIDSVTDSLYIQNPPNNGTVTQVGVGLGVGNITDVLGFDIQPLSGGGNAAFAAMSTNGTSSSLYTIDLVTGIATLVGSIGVAPTLVTGLAVVPAIANPPATLYGIDLATDNLIRFSAANPSVIKSSAPVTGLISGDTIVGIDFRPATGQLYGLGSGGRLYTINTTTAVATLVASLAADPADLT